MARGTKATAAHVQIAETNHIAEPKAAVLAADPALSLIEMLVPFDGGGSLAAAQALNAIKTVDPVGNHAWTQDHDMAAAGPSLYVAPHPMADPNGGYVSGQSGVKPLPLPLGAAPITDPGDAHGWPFRIEGAS